MATATATKTKAVKADNTETWQEIGRIETYVTAKSTGAVVLSRSSEGRLSLREWKTTLDGGYDGPGRNGMTFTADTFAALSALV